MSAHNTFLSHFDGRRDNNFTLFRIFFAWLVLYGHSYAIQKSTGISDPLSQIFQGSTWIGSLAVNGFFAISGFLVCASLIKRGLYNYIISRIIRIYPALIVCVLLSIFVLGPTLTSLSLVEYFKHSDTFKYFANATLYLPNQWNLPGVFENNHTRTINGSLWSLPLEARCYFLLAVAGAFGLLIQKQIANFIILSIILFGFFFPNSIPVIPALKLSITTSLYFILGVAFYINRKHILLNYKIAIFCILLIANSFGEEWFVFVFPIPFIYLIFYFVYCVKTIDEDSKVGDFSYGVYIYAWPVQNTIASFFPDLTPLLNTVFSTVIVFPLALVSWHYIEKPILKLKSKLIKT